MRLILAFVLGYLGAQLFGQIMRSIEHHHVYESSDWRTLDE